MSDMIDRISDWDMELALEVKAALEAAQADIALLTVAAKRADNIEAHRDKLQAEIERLRSELRDGATYLVECGKQFASIGGHVMQSGCYDVAERLKDSAALAATGETDDDK